MSQSARGLSAKEAIALIQEHHARLAAEAVDGGEDDDAPANDPWAIAVHEAGHAVVAYVLGLRPQSVTARADDDSAGHTVIEDPYDIRARLQRDGVSRDVDTIMRGRILAMMAGREAEEELLGTCQGGDGDDRYRIALMFDTLPEIDSKEPRMRQFARSIVWRHRAAIDRVARTLMTVDTIDADGIGKLVSSSRTATVVV